MAGKNSIADFFDDLEDPRVEGRCKYTLQEVIAIAICAIISGYETWKDMAVYAEAKEDWLSSWLPLEEGTPSHDTFGRVFALLDPAVFQEGFSKWVESACELTKGAVVAIDGKTLRRSHNRKKNKQAIHMVSAWAHENGLCLGQVKTSEKSNEITAIPELLDKLGLAGCIVTIDAMGCQKAIAEKIIEQEADYVICLKGTQGTLRDHVESIAEDIIGKEFDDYTQKHIRRVEEAHGRREVRDYWLIEDCYTNDIKDDWPGLRTYGVARSEVTINGETTVDTRYFISSLPCNVTEFARAVREHWSIENSLHWCLDVTYREDESRIRTGHAPENMALLRRLAISALKKAPPPPHRPKSRKKGGKPALLSGKPRTESVRSKGKYCALSDQYLLQVLGGV